MSDPHRKDFSTQAKEEITPDSSKSTMDRVKESLTNKTDHVAASTQSDQHKSGTQAAFDKSRREKDQQTSNGGVIDKTKHALGMDKH